MNMTGLLLATLLAVSTPSMDKTTASPPQERIKLPLRYDVRCLSICAEKAGGLMPESCIPRCDRDDPAYRPRFE
jgi:hypothetical protein